MSRSAPPTSTCTPISRIKQRTLDRITPPCGHPGRYRAPDTLLAFLEICKSPVLPLCAESEPAISGPRSTTSIESAV